MKKWIPAFLLLFVGLLSGSAAAITDTEVNPVIISHENVIHDEGTTVHMSESICSDGKRFVYYCVFQGSDAKPTLIKRYDTKTGNVDTSTDNHVYGHANGMAYVPDENMLYVVSMDNNSTIYKVSAKTLNYVSEFSLGEAIRANIPGAKKCGAIAYDAVQNQLLCLISPYNGKRAFAVFERNGNFKQYKEFAKLYVAGGLATDENFIYLTFSAGPKNYIYVYNRSGDEVSKVEANWYKEIEGVAKIGNDYYMAFNTPTYRSVEIEKCTICGLQTGGHPYNNGTVTTPPTCTEKGVKTYTCTLCGTTKEESIPATGHKLVKTNAKKATYAQVGNKEYYTCKVCKKLFADAAGREETTKSDVLLVRLVKTPLNQCKVTLSKSSYVYNGKAKKPTVTVKSGSKTVPSSEYTIAYTNNKKVGTAAVILKAKTGSVNFAGTIRKTFAINPSATALKTVSPSSAGFAVKWNKKATQTTGYQIQYATNPGFAGAKIRTIESPKKISAKISKLAAKKDYYVRVRTYKTVGGMKYYSSWSKSKKVTTKK